MKTDKRREERRLKIVTLLEKYKSLSVDELSDHFEVTGATIRTDLQALAENNKVIRTHGKAVIVSERPISPLAERIHSMDRQKKAIGAAAAEMVKEGDIIGLDASSTAIALAHALKDRNQLTVVTNCMPVAEEFVNHKQIKVIIPGGKLKHDSASIVGPGAVEFLSALRLNLAFVGAHSLSLETGLGEGDPDEVEIKRVFLRIAKTRVLVADTSKWNRLSLTSFAPWEHIHVFVTDSSISDRDRETLEKQGTKVTAAAIEKQKDLILGGLKK